MMTFGMHRRTWRDLTLPITFRAMQTRGRGDEAFDQVGAR